MIGLRNADYWRDPYPVREREPAAGATTVTDTGEPALLSADNVEFLHTDRNFSTPGLLDLERLGICDGPFYEWCARTLNVMNGPDHERLRSYVGRVLSSPDQAAAGFGSATDPCIAQSDPRNWTDGIYLGFRR